MIEVFPEDSSGRASPASKAVDEDARPTGGPQTHLRIQARQESLRELLAQVSLPVADHRGLDLLRAANACSTPWSTPEVFGQIHTQMEEFRDRCPDGALAAQSARRRTDTFVDGAYVPIIYASWPLRRFWIGVDNPASLAAKTSSSSDSRPTGP